MQTQQNLKLKMQNYQNHKRFYTPHHFVFYPLSLALLIFCVREYFTSTQDELKWLWLTATFIVILIIWLSFMVRQHYGMTLQNRLVCDELRFRYFTLTGKRLEDLGYQFSDSQLFALRFAMDNDLPEMVQKTIANKWSADDIKKNIPAWNADHKRI